MVSKKEDEAEVKKINRIKLIDVMDKMNLGVSITDKEYNLLYVNPVVQKEFGPVAGQKCYEYLHGRTEPCHFCKIEQVLNGKTTSWEWYSFKTRKYFSLFDIPIYLNNDVFKLEFFYNISDYKETKQKLMESEMRFRAIFDSTHQAIGLLNPQGILIDINQTALECGGTSYEEAINRPFWNLKWWSHSQHSRQQLKQAISRAAQGEFVRYETEAVDKEGEKIILDFSIKPIFDENSEVNMLIAEGRDISDHRRLEKEIASLEHLNAVREMAAVMSHEVRNPITTIRGMLQVLQSKPELGEHKQKMDMIIEELDRINSMLSDYLDLAKNNKPVEFQKYNLNAIIQKIAPLISTYGKKESKFVNIDLQDVDDLLVDEKEMRQLILNLARNGLEAMSPGKSLTIRTRQENDQVVLSVEDEGEGIENEVIDKIGTPFFTTKEQGTGLGLAVCYRIAKKHNASISVETGRQGTCFCIRFKA